MAYYWVLGMPADTGTLAGQFRRQDKQFDVDAQHHSQHRTGGNVTVLS